jgi:hypothetical protein
MTTHTPAHAPTPAKSPRLQNPRPGARYYPLSCPFHFCTLIFLFSLTACEKRPESAALPELDKTIVLRYVPTTQEERVAVARCVVEICEASRSQATHSAEDTIKQAERTAMNSLCRPTRWKWNKLTGGYDIPLEPRCFE